jgi:hypothetical protein
MEEFEGADWVLVADDLPVDEARRDELLETFQSTYHGGDGREVVPDLDDDVDDGDEDDDERIVVEVDEEA